MQPQKVRQLTPEAWKGDLLLMRWLHVNSADTVTSAAQFLSGRRPTLTVALEESRMNLKTSSAAQFLSGRRPTLTAALEESRKNLEAYQDKLSCAIVHPSTTKPTASTKRATTDDDDEDVMPVAKRKAVESTGGTVREERYLPTGVYKAGKYFNCRITWGGKCCYVGTFNTPSCAYGACVSVMEIRDATNLSGLSADEVDAAFDAARKRAIDSVGGPKFLRTKSRLSSGQNQVIMAYVSEADEREVEVSRSDAIIDKLLGEMPISAEDDIAFIRSRTKNIIAYIQKLRRKGLEWKGLEWDNDDGSVGGMSIVFNPDTIEEGLMRAFLVDDPLPSYDDGLSVDSNVSIYAE